MYALYRIYNLKTDQTYYNVSDDSESVCAEERFRLDLGMHECRKLQEDYTATGLELFVIEVLETGSDPARLEKLCQEKKAEAESNGLPLYL